MLSMLQPETCMVSYNAVLPSAESPNYWVSCID